MSGNEPGPLAEEAARLVEAALAWAQRAASAVDPAGERIATGAPECAGCPVCRTVSALRDPDPELAERLTGVLTDMASLLVTGLRTVEARTGHRPRAPHRPAAGEPPEPRPGPARRGPGVEHIDIA